MECLWCTLLYVHFVVFNPKAVSDVISLWCIITDTGWYLLFFFLPIITRLSIFVYTCTVLLYHWYKLPYPLSSCRLSSVSANHKVLFSQFHLLMNEMHWMWSSNSGTVLHKVFGPLLDLFLLHTDILLSISLSLNYLYILNTHLRFPVMKKMSKISLF